MYTMTAWLYEVLI